MSSDNRLAIVIISSRGVFQIASTRNAGIVVRGGELHGAFAHAEVEYPGKASAAGQRQQGPLRGKVRADDPDADGRG